MIRYLLRRTLLLLVALFVASVLIFLLLRLLPGDVATTIGGLRATPAQLAKIRAELGLDRPLTAQYGSWLVGLLGGDFGRSQLTGVSVSAELDSKLQVTAPLVGGGIVVALLIAVPFGILAALRHRSGIGGGISAVAQLGIAVPSFWLGLVLALLFAVELRILPAQGFPVDGWHSPGVALRALILPWLALGLSEGRSCCASSARPCSTCSPPTTCAPREPRAAPGSARCSRTACATPRCRSPRCSACRSPG